MTAKQPRILIVEDDRDLREALQDSLSIADIDVCVAASAEDALQHMQRDVVDMVVSDVNMPGMDGHELLGLLRQRYPQVPVLLITAHGSINKSVAAMRAGAVDYLVKPFPAGMLIDAIHKHTGHQLPAGNHADGEPVAVAASSRDMLALARRVAATDSSVLICGESGTGKEVLARYIHQHSPRAAQPFIAINCAAIPENMLEATLFGYEKGAYTGAVAAMPGKFEQANGGTLLLDEISEMPPPLQAKLLRVLQEREVERLGARRLIALDVRVIATSNRDLREAVRLGQFREDLYFRLCVLPLQWKPLRERVEDILPLATQLLARHALRQHRGPVTFAADAKAALLAYHFPGNVRELDNIVQRALILQPGLSITAEDLYLEMSLSHLHAQSPVSIDDGHGEGPALQRDMKSHEYQIIMDTLQHARGSRKTAAERLGISPRTLRYKLAQMREHGVAVDA